MSYADSLMAKDERILYRGRQHWLAPVSDALRPIVILLVGLVIFFLAAFVQGQRVRVAGHGRRQRPARHRRHRLDRDRLSDLARRGVRHHQPPGAQGRRAARQEEPATARSTRSTTRSSSRACWRGCCTTATSEILTANDDAIDRYEMLSHVVDFKKAMLNAKNDLEDGYRGATSGARPVAAAAPSAPSGKASSSDDVTATLAKLADLRDKGAITPAEYEAKKAELLGRL